MKCPKCGAEIQGNFCSNCGTSAIRNAPDLHIPPLRDPYIIVANGYQFDANLLISCYGLGFSKCGAYSYLSQKIHITYKQARAILEPIIQYHLDKNSTINLLERITYQNKLNISPPLCVKETESCQKETSDTKPIYDVKESPIVSTSDNSIKICLNCGDKLLPQAIKCPTCGIAAKDFPLYSKDKTEEIEAVIATVPHPKETLSPVWQEKLKYRNLNLSLLRPAQTVHTQSGENLSTSKCHRKSKHELKQQAQSNGQACCPKCGSISLSANKKGFGIGKAVMGASLVGGIGLVAGNIGARKVWVTCLNCGHRWKL